LCWSQSTDLSVNNCWNCSVLLPYSVFPWNIQGLFWEWQVSFNALKLEIYLCKCCLNIKFLPHIKQNESGWIWSSHSGDYEE
jgi:hypothetical protein